MRLGSFGSHQLRSMRERLRRADTSVQRRQLLVLVQSRADGVQERLRRSGHRRPRLRCLRCDVRDLPVVCRWPLHLRGRHHGVRGLVRRRRDRPVELRSMRRELQGLDVVLQPGCLRSVMQRRADGMRSRVRRHPHQHPQLRWVRPPLPRRRAVLGGHVRLPVGTGAVQRRLRELEHDVRRPLRRPDRVVRRALREHELGRAQLRSLRSDLPRRRVMQRRSVQMRAEPHAVRRGVRRHTNEHSPLRRLRNAVRDRPRVPRRTMRAVIP